MPLIERLIGVDDRAAWEAALATVDHVYWQRWAPCRAASLSSGLPTYLYVCADEAGATLAVCPFSVRRCQGTSDIFTPTGFGGFAARGDVRRLRDTWCAFVAREGYVCGYFALHPMLQAEGMHDGLRDTNDLFFVDLSRGPDAVRAGAQRLVRRELREWEAAGAEYVVSRDVLVAFIRDHYLAFMAAAGANPAALFSREALTVLCEDPSALLVGASDAGGVCAVSLFGCAPTGAEHVIALSVRDGRRYTRALVWWGIRELAGRGVSWLGLGGGIRRGDRLAGAKRMYRPTVRPLLGACEIYEPAVFDRVCRETGVGGTAGPFFPPYHRRDVPAPSSGAPLPAL